MIRITLLSLIVFLLFACAEEGTSTVGTTPTNSSSSVTPGPGPTPGPTGPYPYGVLPDNINLEAVQAMYNRFIADYYVESPDGSMARIEWADGNANHAGMTVSEGIGYAMLITLWQGDQARFDKLYRYYRASADTTATKLMHWAMTGFSGADRSFGLGSASDADLDVALALLNAHVKWGVQEYFDRAMVAADTFKVQYFARPEDGYYLLPGDRFDFPYNPSYVSLILFRTLQNLDQALKGTVAWQTPGSFVGAPPFNYDWPTVIQANMNLLDICQADHNGLWFDWCTEAGVPDYTRSSNANFFFLDAVRAPWRVGMDYLWYGTDKSAEMSYILSVWANNFHGGDASQVVWKYNFYDRFNNSYINPVQKVGSSFFAGTAGAFGVAAMAAAAIDPTLKPWLNSCYQNTLNYQAADDDYFNAILQMLMVQTMSGLAVNYWQ